MEQKKLKPWHGIVSFVVMMVIFVLAAFPIQGALGLFGVAITEFLLLAMAIGAALIFKQNLKEVFPIKLPKIREVLGVLIFWVGGFLVAMMGIMIQTVLFPQDNKSLPWYIRRDGFDKSHSASGSPHEKNC